MLVFVISNMLFDSYMANHFRKLAIDHDKEGEMILVVNKMEKTAKGNTLEQQGIIREDLRRVLAPCTPEKLRVCFIDALSYLDSVELKDEDPDLSKELFDRSGYNDFIATLNHFVKEKGMIGRLTTELYQLEGCLQNAIKKVEPESGDKDIDAFKEKLLQERHAYSDARTRVLQELKDIYSNAANTVRRYGDEAADLLVEGCKQKEVEEGLAQKIQAAKDIMENCQNDAEGILRTRLFETQEDIDAIESDEVSIRLKARLNGKFDSLPVNVKKAFDIYRDITDIFCDSFAIVTDMEGNEGVVDLSGKVIIPTDYARITYSEQYITDDGRHGIKFCLRQSDLTGDIITLELDSSDMTAWADLAE
jgi:hypothetical protein